LDFVACYEGVNIREAALMVNEWFVIAGEPPPRSLQEAPGSLQTTESLQADFKVEAQSNPPLAFELKTLNPKHRYLRDRGLKRETIETFGLGYCSRGLFKGRIAIPIHNEKGELVAYAGRLPTLPSQTGPREPPMSEPKYRLPKGAGGKRVVA